MATNTKTETTAEERLLATKFEEAVRRVENAKHELNVSSSGYSGNLMWDAEPAEYIGRLHQLRNWKRLAVIEMDIAIAEVEKLLEMGGAEAYRKVEIEKTNAREEAIRMAASAKKLIADTIDENIGKEVK